MNVLGLWFSDKAHAGHVGLLDSVLMYTNKIQQFSCRNHKKNLPHVVAILTLLISSLRKEGNLDSFTDFAPWCDFQDQAVMTAA